MDTPSNERIALDILTALLSQPERDFGPLEKDAKRAVKEYKAILKHLREWKD